MLCRKVQPNFLQTIRKFNNFKFVKKSASFEPKQNNQSFLINLVENAKINSIKDWTQIRRSILESENNRGTLNNNNIDAMILSYCVNHKKFDLGISYVDFLKQEKNKLNLATTGKFLKLLYSVCFEEFLLNNKKLPKAKEKQIFQIYDGLRQEYPVLDSFTLENSIFALSVTSRWEECLQIMKEIKITSNPSSLTYSTVISAAFLNGKDEIAWKILNEMIENAIVPSSIIFVTYIKTVEKIKLKETQLERMEKLFEYFHENDILCKEDAALAFGQIGEKLGFKKVFSTVNFKGTCRNCQKQLKKFELTDEEFTELKKKLFEKVIVGKDVFVKTNPEELENFKKFVTEMGKFDVILDGLNVAYSTGAKHNPQVFSYLVASVVSHFVKQGKKVLVLGRVHMTRWPRKNWNFVTQNASVFLTQNISQDDPYLLYCALNSGKDTIIVTRDLMRSHKFLLKTTRLKMLFERWLSQRQYQLVRVDEQKGPIFRIPPPFCVTAQKNERAWHIPYQSANLGEKDDFHRHWLCLTK